MIYIIIIQFNLTFTVYLVFSKINKYMLYTIFSELKSESKKKERRKDDKLKGENTSTTDEELMDSQRKLYFYLELFL